MLSETLERAPDLAGTRCLDFWEGDAWVRKGRHGIGMAILYVLVGGIVGSVLGTLLVHIFSPLARPLLVLGSIPGPDWTLNLGVVGVRFGGWVRLNLLGVVGLVAGFGWFWRSRAQ